MCYVCESASIVSPLVITDNVNLFQAACSIRARFTFNLAQTNTSARASISMTDSNIFSGVDVLGEVSRSLAYPQT